MARGDVVELKFRLPDGVDIGPGTFTGSTTVRALKGALLGMWPEYEEVTPKTINDLTLINAGKILENHRTIAESGVRFGDLSGGIVTMHVVVRPSLHDDKQLSSSPQGGCGCTIL